MTDLRSALREACDIIGHLHTDAITGRAGLSHGMLADLARLRTLADVLPSPCAADRHRHCGAAECCGPLTVLDALRDPEVRAGRVSPVYNIRGVDAVLTVDRAGTIYVKTPGMRRRAAWTPDVADLDAPCRLVPAEVDRG